MSSEVISRALLSSVRDQLLSSAKQERERLVEELPEHRECPQPSGSADHPVDVERPTERVDRTLDKTGLHTMKLDTYPSTDPLLNELLGDIRKSCATSLASTPTLVSSDGDRDSIFECKLRRSEAELRSLEISELNSIMNTLSQEVECVSTLLVKLLRSKNRLSNKSATQSSRLTLILKMYASRNGLDSELEFSLYPPVKRDDYHHWLAAWKVLSRLPKGIPKLWRKTLWSELATQGTSHLDWSAIESVTFSEIMMPGDEALGSQIVKDLHRTGNTGFITEQEHAVLKRVLLAYARFNKSIGYCQGFNILAALILKVVDFDEYLTLKVMVFLIDYKLPENFFAQNLYALSADMATFRDVIKHFLPELSSHLEELRKQASGSVQKSYSSDNPPDLQSIHGYEPPLVDVFTMQWFLTMFATSLPRKATRRVWDLIFLEGSVILIYTAVAVLAVVEKELLQSDTAADFYTIMAQFGEKLRKAQLLPSSEFMEIVYTILDCATSPNSTIPNIAKLREKYTYNICPWAMPEDEDKWDVEHGGIKKCPPPTCGGSLSFGDRRSQGFTHQNSTSKPIKQKVSKTRAQLEDHFLSNQAPVSAQVKLLKEYYTQTTRQPQKLKCNLGLLPPHARVVCPQTKKSVATQNGTAYSYAADVPNSVLEKSKDLSGYNYIEELQRYKQRVFMLSYFQADMAGCSELGVGSNGILTDGRERERKKMYTAHEDMFIRYSTGSNLP